MPITVHEITMATPDIICLKVRDQAITKGNLLALASPDAGTINSIVQRDPVTGGAGSAYCRVVGLNKMYLRFFDTPPTVFLDRTVAYDPAQYATIGGRTVTNVYVKTMPYDQGFSAPAGVQISEATFEHTLFLKLDGNLPQGGPYTISATGDPFPSTAFTFGDKTSRALAIRATQIGHRREDGDKVAHLCLWIPGYGTEGRVDFASTYGLTTFHIIDANGVSHFSGPITQRVDATTAEDAGANIRYPSTTVTPLTITGITNADPGVVTYTGADPSNGDVLWFRGIGGMTQLEAAKIVVANVNAGANTFEIGLGSTRVSGSSYVSFTSTVGFGTFAAGTYQSAWDAKADATFLANRAATYVYGLDYSAWEACEFGLYRIYIPGLGVSDEFRIDDAVHYQRAKSDFKGFYNQCFGMALDADIGGWDRPVNYKHGTNGVVIYESKLPAAFVDENPVVTSPASILSRNAALAAQPWITATQIPDWIGYISDAGDWDFHIYRHIPIAYELLDMCYERLPESSRNTDFGFPKSSTTLDSATYAGTDILPDAVHMAIWMLDGLRRTQNVDGRVYSGIQYDGNGGGSGGGGNTFEPSWCSQQQAVALAADPTANFLYAMAAAKLAIVLQADGFTTLAATWLDSAVSAFDWAEALYQSHAGDGVTRDAYFITTLDIKTKAGWSDPQYTTAMTNLFNACGAATGANAGLRGWAMGCLFRATGDMATYGLRFYDNHAVTMTGFGGSGAWEYASAPTFDATHGTHKAYYNGRWGLTADGNYDEQFTGVTSYRYSGDSFSLSPGDPGLVLRAFIHDTQDQSNKYLKLIHAGENFWSGANQMGLSCTTGVGSRYPINSLIRDREAMADLSSEVAGSTLFMWWTDNHHGLAFNNLSTENTANFTFNRPTTSDGIKRTVMPYNHALPVAESHYDNSFMIYNTEFTTQTSIVPRLKANLWRHGWDGNTSRNYSPRRFGFRL